MSLSIEVYDGSVSDAEHAAALWSRPFGVETTRKTIWGSPAVRALGLEWLPRLAEQSYIEVQDEDLAALEHDARTVLDNLANVLGSAEDRAYMKVRLELL